MFLNPGPGGLLARSYRFGAVEVRPSERQLLVKGQPAPVGARAFDVLLALIDNRDRVVSKNELLDLVWPGLVVEENNLQVHISTLRKLLGSTVIATIPGRGYRFTAEFDGAAEDVAAPPAARPSPGVSPLALGNLPRQLPPLIGRDDQLRALSGLIENHPLITVVGAAGIGK